MLFQGTKYRGSINPKLAEKFHMRLFMEFTPPGLPYPPNTDQLWYYNHQSPCSSKAIPTSKRQIVDSGKVAKRRKIVK